MSPHLERLLGDTTVVERVSLLAGTDVRHSRDIAAGVRVAVAS